MDVLASHSPYELFLRTRNQKSLRPGRELIHQQAARVFATHGGDKGGWGTLAPARYIARTRALYSISSTD